MQTRRIRATAVALLLVAVTGLLAACSSADAQSQACNQADAALQKATTELNEAQKAKNGDGPNVQEAQANLPGLQQTYDAAKAAKDEACNPEESTTTVPPTVTAPTSAAAPAASSTTTPGFQNIAFSQKARDEVPKYLSQATAEQPDGFIFNIDRPQGGEQVIFNRTPNWALNAEERGSAAFTTSTLKSPDEVKAFYASSSDKAKAAKAQPEAALKAIGKTLDDCRFVPVQFLESVDYKGMTYYKASTKKAEVDPSVKRAPSGDVLWLCAVPNGQTGPNGPEYDIVWGATTRADCGNAGEIVVTPVKWTPEAKTTPVAEPPKATNPSSSTTQAPTTTAPTPPPSSSTTVAPCTDLVPAHCPKVPAENVTNNTAVTGTRSPGAGGESAPAPVIPPGTPPEIPVITTTTTTAAATTTSSSTSTSSGSSRTTLPPASSTSAPATSAPAGPTTTTIVVSGSPPHVTVGTTPICDRDNPNGVTCD